MACTSILRMGGPQGSEIAISILKDHLSNHFPSQSSQSQSQSQSQSHHLQISNKYFTAQVNLLPFHEQQDQDEAQDQDQIQTLNKEDGILLIFPSSTHIDNLTQIHDDIPQDKLGDTLRLCISTSAKPIAITKEYELLYSQRVLWCLDRGYEYVEVDLSEEGLMRGFDDREKDGFARVVEAMGGTVWSSAVMGKKKKNNVSVSIAQTLLEHCDDEDIHNTKEAKEAMVGIKTKTEAVLMEEEAAERNTDVQVAKDGEFQLVPDMERSELISESEVSDETKDEVVFDNIEGVMKEAKIIREASKNGKLSDQERRDRAGNAAEMLMGLLGQMGFDDDDDEGEDSSDDDE